jgi:hypothetical protein
VAIFLVDFSWAVKFICCGGGLFYSVLLDAQEVCLLLYINKYNSFGFKVIIFFVKEFVVKMFTAS